MKKKLSRLWEDICWHWHDKVGTLYSWWDNLCRICSFIPVLWRDWDFDARPGLYQVMRKKLERLEPCLREGHLLHGERYARQVRVAIAVLDRIIADEYEEEELAPHNKKWGRPNFNFLPAENDCFEMKMERREVKTTEDAEQERAEFMQAMHRADARLERDIEWVFRFIARWHRYWWD